MHQYNFGERSMKKILQLSLGTSFILALVFNAIFTNVFMLERYEKHYLETAMDQQLDLPYETVVEATAILFAYVKDQREDMILNIEFEGQSESYYNQREIDHMVDVKNLYLNAVKVYQASLWVFVLSALILFKLKSLKLNDIKSAFIMGLGLVGAILVAIGISASVDFQAFWIQFHKLFFTNDLWLLNPLTDRMIVMFNLDFFMKLVLDILLTTTLSLGLSGLVLYHQSFIKIKLNSRFFKFFALIIMTIDHVGHFLLPEFLLLRVIGRLAFPIFTFLFAKSARYTQDRSRLLISLSIAAIAGQSLMFVSGATEIISIFFLFVAGLLSFMAIDAKKSYLMIPLFFLVEYFHVDYGAYGLLVLIGFYVFKDSFFKQALAYTIATLIFTFIPLVNPELWPMIPEIMNGFLSYYWRYFIQALSILALIPLAFYQEEKPKSFPKPYNSVEKYFFYAYYPIHLALLALLRAIQ
jgi:integral membrane protein (TIGR01906 family)